MELYMIFVWIGVIVLAIVAEALTVQFVSIWFVAGGVAGLIANAMNVPVWPQVLIAAVVTLLLLLCTRSFVSRKLMPKKSRTNSDRYIGESGIVLEEVNNMEDKGQVKVMDKIWTARSDDGSLISKGAAVKVLRIEGVKVIVARVQKRQSRAE